MTASLFYLPGNPGMAIAVFLFAYVTELTTFLPAIIAFARSHENKWPIAALTIFGGWTGIGWLAALVWACAKPVKLHVSLEHGN
jgi:Superinfection immunity protein